VHEAGHTIAMMAHYNSTPVFISLDNYRGAGTFIPKDDAMRATFTKKDLECEIGVILGGMVAEEELGGTGAQTVGASQDLMHATEIARRMVVEYGFGDKMSNKSLVALQDYAITSGVEVLDDIQKILDNAMETTSEIIAANKEVLEKLVDELLGKVLMNGEALTVFFSRNPLVATAYAKGQPA
jgi:cell division protease FtsH